MHLNSFTDSQYETCLPLKPQVLKDYKPAFCLKFLLCVALNFHLMTKQTEASIVCMIAVLIDPSQTVLVQKASLFLLHLRGRLTGSTTGRTWAHSLHKEEASLRPCSTEALSHAVVSSIIQKVAMSGPTHTHTHTHPHKVLKMGRFWHIWSLGSRRPLVLLGVFSEADQHQCPAWIINV